MKNCQLYKYNKEGYQLIKESAEYFAHNFYLTHIEKEFTTWLNYHGLEEKEFIELLCEHLSIERTCVDSIFTDIRRAKVEEYDSYMFFTIKSAIPSKEEYSGIGSEQITFVLSHDYLISFQEKPGDYFSEIRYKITRDKGIIRKKSTDFLLFRMLEAIVDSYFNTIDSISEEIEKIEGIIHSSKDSSIIDLIEGEKRKLIELRKIAIPMRDITIQLEGAETQFLHDNNNHYFSNLKLLCDSVLEEIDACKQILDGQANLYYAAQGQKMNQIMKILTVVSAIFIPLTFIAGVYGMNFQNMPELAYKNGYYVVVGVMFLIGLGLLTFFIKKGWLKNNK